ncbi:MAG: hypothetical protein QOF09_4172 [Alphaproteobacteria bacterium]|jgi:hypothetical protein|nr:hypothetical protein [Alphaproteobacteria bacterium]
MKTKAWRGIPCAMILAASFNTAALTQDSSGASKESSTANTEQAKPAAEAAPKPAESAKPKRTTGRIALKTDPKDGSIISPYSLAYRTAMNREDCKPNNLKKDGLGIHGHYRTYGQWDPELKSIEGRRQFEACVKRGLEPTPWFAFGQRMVIASGGKFFGRGKEECLMCHSKY